MFQMYFQRESIFAYIKREYILVLNIFRLWRSFRLYFYGYKRDRDSDTVFIISDLSRKLANTSANISAF